LVENLKRLDRKKRPKIPSATKRVHDRNRELGWDGREIEEVEPGMPNDRTKLATRPIHIIAATTPPRYAYGLWVETPHMREGDGS
jgi:hypothetical protein